MTEYLVLLKLNPGRIIDTLGTLRNLPTTPIAGVNLCYELNIFGAWDVGIWINAENSGQALEFVQEKVKDMTGVTEVYTIPTFPHANAINSEDVEEVKATEEQKRPSKK